jgi:hypothetical protein
MLMAGGALSQFYTDPLGSMEQETQGYLDARGRSYAGQMSALEELKHQLRMPSQNLSALHMARGFLKPTRSGSFGEEMGNAIEGYTSSAEKAENERIERAIRLARINEGLAKIGGSAAADRYNTVSGLVGMPEKALEARDALEEYQNPGRGGVGPMPGAHPNPSVPGRQGSLPSDRSTLASVVGGPAAETAVPMSKNRLAELTARMRKHELVEAAKRPMPGYAAGGALDFDDEGYEGDDDIVFLDTASDQAPAPRQVAQAQTAAPPVQAQPQAPAQAPQPAMGAFTPEQIEWAHKVLQDSSVNRRYYEKRGKLDLQNAWRIIQQQQQDQRAQAVIEQRRESARTRNGVTEKMRNELGTAENIKKILGESLQNYQTLVDEHGAELMPTEAKSKIGTAYNDIKMKLKDFYGLGAIQAPDVPILESLLLNAEVNPKLRSDFMENPAEFLKFWNTSGRVKAQIGELHKMLDRDLAAKRSTITQMEGQAQGAPAQGAPAPAAPTGPVQIRNAQDWQSLPPGTRYIDPDGNPRIKQ